MARYDKYEPKVSGSRAALAGAWTGSATPVGVGIDSNGRLVAGAGQTGIVGVLAKPDNAAAGEVVDYMDLGQIVEFAGAAGTVYSADTTTGAITATAPSATKQAVGYTVEATRLIVRVGIRRAAEAVE